LTKAKTSKVNSSAKKEKQFVYIVQEKSEKTRCKIGITDNLERRLKEYNSITGKSKDNVFRYLFKCEVKDMRKVENDLKKDKSHLRETDGREIYFYNDILFEEYVTFIKNHKDFIKEIRIKTADNTKKQIVKIVKKTTPTLVEREKTRRDILQKAQKVKNDEFYTRYEDVEKEISMYNKGIWKNKTVFCNCDDAVDNNENNTSAFSLYFLKYFKALGLKKLICTHYVGGVNNQYDLFDQGNKGYIFTKEGFKVIRDYNKYKEYPKGYNGSFDHPLSLKILKEDADIVCTNPPFSRASEYWDITIKSGKKFLIISNFTNVVTRVFIPFFKNNQVWAGYNRVDWFLTPKKELTMASGHWYTNIPIKNRPKYKNMKIMPLKEIPDKNKKYDDNRILLVDNNYIPNDYKKSFAISAYPMLSGILEKGYKLVEDKEYYPYINGKKCFARVLIQKK
jgi:predicted GIY-YIG superfamily endonuclease